MMLQLSRAYHFSLSNALSTTACRHIPHPPLISFLRPAPFFCFTAALSFILTHSALCFLPFLSPYPGKDVYCLGFFFLSYYIELWKWFQLQMEIHSWLYYNQHRPTLSLLSLSPVFFSLITQLYTCCLLCLNTHPFSPSLHLSLSFKCFLRRFQTAKDAGDISKCPIVFHSQELCTPSRAQFICCRLEPKYCHLPWLAERCVKTQEANLRAANFFPVARCSHSDSQWQILSDIFWRESQRKREKKRSLCTKAHQAWLTVTYDVIFSSEVIFMSNLMCVFFESPDFSCCRKFM